ncbi:MAG: glutathione S-transferase family protein [Alphaproteobacteria bacterium]
MSTLRVFTFSADWGLPTTGPFSLKLLAWMRLAGLSYELKEQNDPSKGPLGKVPWVEIDGRPMADSELIIAELGRRHGFDVDAGLSPVQAADAHAWRRAFEEGFHQVLEWELFIHPAGAAYVERLIAGMAPPLVRSIVTAKLRGHFRKQLQARGLGRHAPSVVADKGRADIDALAARLADRPYLVGDGPSMADLAVFGQVAPMVRWPMATPVAQHAKAQKPVVDFVERVFDRCFEASRAAA